MNSASRQALYKQFDPESYLKFKSRDGESVPATSVYDWMYGIFSEGYVKGETLLEIGTGPNISTALYATPHFNKIYLSDFSKNNLKFLEEWRGGCHQEAQRYFVEEVVKREGNRQTPESKERELLTRIQDVLHCDVMQENPLCGNAQQLPLQFDAVITTWCLDAAAATKAEYEQALKNVSTVIKPGGYLLLMGICPSLKEYTVKGVTFPAVNINIDESKSTFEVPYMKVLQMEIKELTFKGNQCYLYNVAAQIL